jgi:hypothetical protein
MLLEGDEVLAPASPMFAPIAVRPMVAAVPLAAGGAGRVQRRSKLAPVVPSASAAASGAGLPPGLQPGLQADEESAGPPASVEVPELPEIVRRWPAVGEAERIAGAPAQITRRSSSAGDLADLWKIETTEIVNWDRRAIVERAIVGPPFKDLWNVGDVMKAFAPTLYSHRRNAQRALAQTSIADYPSRMEVQMAHHNVSKPDVLYHSY